MNVRHDMVSVFVIRPDESGGSHEFLQLHRAAGDYLGGTWQLVRGGVEPHESYVAAALRELREEAGLSPRELYRLGSVESFYTDVDDTLWHAVPFCAVVDRDAPVVLNAEHDAFRWVPRRQIESLLMWPSERQLLADLLHHVLAPAPARAHLQVRL
ncbi:NUDIX domain-containing protein [Fontivita pretiosa]|jgi:8-oxo-dGTP pyrophosphatase MutT (NUDIX family)|uniref:NUDIX domain-containing protein n=1 Tax=Fontivita pretiosa TaxID=2989684 RepID=UPI003D16D2B2